MRKETIVNKEELQKRLRNLISEVVIEVLSENGLKEQVKQTVRNNIIQKISTIAEKEATILINELD